MARSATGKPNGRPPSAKTVLMRQVEAVIESSTAKAQSARRVTARYDAAGRGRRMAAWNPPSTGPNRAIEGLQTIRNRARDSRRNDWSGESGVQKWTTTLIGIGITPRFKRIKSKTRRQELIDLWDDFAKQCDADGVNNAYGQQSLATSSWFDSGEVFGRRRARFLDEGLAVPVQVQLLEADMVPMLDADTYQGLPAGNKIRSGIELDKRGKRVAYWVYKEHPGDGGSLNYGANDLIRVAASDMFHVFEQKRPGQLRGVSLLAPILARLRNIENYDDATLERQKIANMFVGFIGRTEATVSGDADIDPVTGEIIDSEEVAAPLLGLQPGLIQELEDGQKMEWSNPPEAGTTYSDYMRTQHMGTAAAVGMPYELFSGDILNISDRALRILINEFRRLAEQRQWQVIIPMMCQRVVDWFVDAAILADKISLEEADDVRRVEHAPHGWAHIHPVQDPQGKKVEVEAGFISRSSVIGGKGDDPDAVDEERQADDEREQALKIGPYSEAAALAAAPAAGADPVDPDDDEPPVDAKPVPSALEQALIARANAETAALVAKAEQLSRVPTPPPADPLAEQRLQLQKRTLDLLQLEPTGGRE